MTLKRLIKNLVIAVAGWYLSSCSAANSDLVMTLQISEAVLIPYTTQSCGEMKIESAASGVVTPVFDVASKYFQFKYPRLVWNGDPTSTVTIIAMQMTPDKNS